MPGARDMVVVGASAGGVEALTKLVRALPRGYAGTLFIVLHVAPEGTSVMGSILQRAGNLPADQAADGEFPKPGRVYVAPPNCHLLIGDDGRMILSAGPKENGHRPAVDPLFRSAAAVYGPRTVGVVLSGSRDDGSAGLRAIKDEGGMAIAQDPSEALAPSMPLSAIEHVAVDAVRPVEEIAALLVRLATVESAVGASGNGRGEAAEAADARAPERMKSASRIAPGNSSGLTCPECSGALWEVKEKDLIQYRCRVGHVYSLESMLAEQARSVEAALWAGVAALEERAQLMRRVADRAENKESKKVSAKFAADANQAEQQATLLREAVTEYAARGLSVLIGPEEPDA